MRDIEFTLAGHRAPPGTIEAYDAERLAHAVRELVYRLTRAAADRAGAGRTLRAVEGLAQVTVALGSGVPAANGPWVSGSGVSRPGGDQGTTVRFSVGAPDTLDVDPYAEEVDLGIGRVLTGLAASRRPGGLTDTVAEAAGRLAAALRRAAPRVVVRTEHLTMELDTAALDLGVWARDDAAVGRVEVLGRLEAIDLFSNHFRLRDGQGQRIELLDVEQPMAAARLVGRQVLATGFYVPASGAGRARVEHARIAGAGTARAPVPTQPMLPWVARRPADAATEPGPEPGDPAPADLGRDPDAESADVAGADGVDPEGAGTEGADAEVARLAAREMRHELDEFLRDLLG